MVTSGQLIDSALIGALALALFSGRTTPARAFAVFALAAIVFGRIDLDYALAALGSPAIWAVVSLVLFSLALAKISTLRRVGIRPTSWCSAPASTALRTSSASAGWCFLPTPLRP